tara:strand:- start:74 stop:487 length:414 start_codon:yes stop_codon:yes gene_type:complete
MANCVYRIECLDTSIKEFYIGSTANLKERIRTHKSSCNNSNSKDYNSYVYKFIRGNGGWNNWRFDVELLTTGMEEKDRKELEQNYLDCLHPDLNSNNAKGLDMEKKKEYDNAYHKENKEKRNASRREKYMLKKTKVI